MPNDLDSIVEEKAKKYVRDAINALGINFGSVNMDMLITEDGKIYIVDIGARMGGNMIGPCIITYGSGVDYMAAMLQNSVGDKVDFSLKEKCSVVTRLLAFEEGIIKFLPDIEQVEKKFDIKIYHHMYQGLHVNKYCTNLDGCGYIVAKAKNKALAMDKAEKALKYLKETIF